MRHYYYKYEAAGPNGETIRSGGFGSFINEFQLRLFISSFHYRCGINGTRIISVNEISEDELNELRKGINKNKKK